MFFLPRTVVLLLKLGKVFNFDSRTVLNNFPNFGMHGLKNCKHFPSCAFKVNQKFSFRIWKFTAQILTRILRVKLNKIDVYSKVEIRNGKMFRNSNKFHLGHSGAGVQRPVSLGVLRAHVLRELHAGGVHLVPKRGQVRGQERLHRQLPVRPVPGVDDVRAEVQDQKQRRQVAVQLLLDLRAVPGRPGLRVVRRRVQDWIGGVSAGGKCR